MLTFQHVINIINVMVYITDFFLSYIFQRLCVYTSQFGVASFSVEPDHNTEELWEDFPPALCCTVGYFWAII